MEAECIGSEETIEQLPESLQKLLQWERRHLHKIQSFQRLEFDPSFDVRYFPQNCGAFPLPCFWIPRRSVVMFGCEDVDADELPLFKECGSARKVLFPIHPTSLRHYSRLLSEVGAEDARSSGLLVWAVPTSSTRTLLAWPDGKPQLALFFKTSLHSPIFGDRRLQTRIVARSVGTSTVLQHMRDALPPGFSCFPESTGMVPRALQDAGVIVRHIPSELKSGAVFAAPLFAMLGGCEPLLLTMLQRAKIEPLQFVREILVAPYARMWLHLSMKNGVMPEGHGQDLLIGLTPELKPLGRFFYRDFEGMQVDWELRRARRLPTPLRLPNASEWHLTYETWGDPYSQLISYKYYFSLAGFADLVLNEIEESLMAWQADGLIQMADSQKGFLLRMFSQEMQVLLHDMFDLHPRAGSTFETSRAKFLMVLLALRTRLMS
jgi:hypothetical protein